MDMPEERQPHEVAEALNAEEKERSMTEERQSEQPEFNDDPAAAQAEEAKALLKQEAARQEAARQEAAKQEAALQEDQIQSAEDQVREALDRLPREPFTVESREYRSTDQTTDFDELISAFPKKFTKIVNVRGIQMKLVCNRLSTIDLFDDDDDVVDPNAIPTAKEMYDDSVTVICKVVDTTLTAQQIEEKLMQLPVSLVTRMSREIMKEISPRWQDDDVGTLEEEDV